MDSLFAFLLKYKPFLFHKGTLALDSSLPSWSLWLLVSTLLVITLAAYRKRFVVPAGPAVTLWERIALVSLRSVLFVLLSVVLFRPVLRVSTVLPRENIAALLIDDSKSMAIQDIGPRGRMEAVKQALDPRRGTLLADVERRFQTRLFRFSRDIKRVDSLDELQPQGTGTNLEDSLESVLKEF